MDHPSSPADALDRRILLGAAGLAGIAALASGRATAGPLNPPAGAVSSSGKTLTEVEPRTAINATNTPNSGLYLHRISQPGSYYLTGHLVVPSLQAGILVAASDVTIDLNGFTIIGGVATTIFVNGGTNNFTLRNGTIRNSQGLGIDAVSTLNTRIEAVTVSGCASGGIAGGTNAIIADCLSTSNGSGVVGGGGTGSVGDGIDVGLGSIIRSCVVRFAGRWGIYSEGYTSISDCYVSDASNPSSVGILASQRTLVRGCLVSACTVGIKAQNISRVESCHVNNCAVAGILLDSGGGNKVIENSVASCGSAAGHAGIRLTNGANGCTVEGNRLEFNYRHIDCASAANLIVRNAMSYTGAGGNWSISAGNTYGPLVVVGGVGDMSATAQSNHPQANIAF